MSNVLPKNAIKLAHIVVWEESKPVLGKVLDLSVDWDLFDLLSLITVTVWDWSDFLSLVTVKVLVFEEVFVSFVGRLGFGFLF